MAVSESVGGREVRRRTHPKYLTVSKTMPGTLRRRNDTRRAATGNMVPMSEVARMMKMAPIWARGARAGADQRKGVSGEALSERGFERPAQSHAKLTVAAHPKAHPVDLVGGTAGLGDGRSVAGDVDDVVAPEESRREGHGE